jgi:hypothetical protein
MIRDARKEVKKNVHEKPENRAFSEHKGLREPITRAFGPLLAEAAASPLLCSI